MQVRYEAAARAHAMAMVGLKAEGCEMADVLLIDKINALQHPLFIRKWGDKDWWWPVYDIGVDVALVRIDVYGILDRLHFGNVAQIKDGNGDMHDPDDFYNEEQPQ